jgi:predicted ABC-type ATPase
MLISKADFAIETTLTTKTYVSTMKKARQQGYKISLLFFWLPNVALAVKRVKMRVSDGGHNIPVVVIKRRYKRGIANLFKDFMEWCHYWVIIDNTGKTFNFIAEGEEQQITSILKIYDDEKWNSIRKQSNKYSE